MSITVLDRYAARSTNCPGCRDPLAPNGSCPPCEFLAYRGDEAAADAQYRLDHMDASTRYRPAQRSSDRKTVQAHRRRRILMERAARTPANGCAQCGRLETEHAQDGRHGYDMPTDRLRLARMRARRALTVQH